MKLQRQKTHKVGGKQYYKYVLVVSEKLVESLGWREGAELKTDVKGEKLVLEKR